MVSVPEGVSLEDRPVAILPKGVLVGAAVVSGAIEIAVAALDHARGRLGAVGALGLAAERVKGGQRSRKRKLEHRAAAKPVGTLIRAESSRAIEVAVAALDHAGRKATRRRCNGTSKGWSACPKA